MPYISEDRKMSLNPFLQQVSERISSREELSYCLTMLACREIRSVNYPEVANIYGDIMLVAQEYWRRIILPLQQSKAREIGDVFIVQGPPEVDEGKPK